MSGRTLANQTVDLCSSKLIIRVKTVTNPKWKEEEEALRKRFTEQVRLEENRFRSWEQQLIAERDRLNKDLEAEHSHIKALEAELESMQVGLSPKRK